MAWNKQTCKEIFSRNICTKILKATMAILFTLILVACGDDGSSADSSTNNDESTTESSELNDILEGYSDYLGGGDWSWDIPKEDYLNSKIKYGTMTDSRDKKVYKTVKIGEQTWMAENLNYADSAKTKSLLGKNRCIDDDVKKCNLTGRRYTWAAAIDSVKLANDSENPQNCGDGIPCFLPSRVQGICPEGWHLPSKEEWEILLDEVGGISEAGKVLKSQKGWDSKYIHGNGLDEVGFSALPTFYLSGAGQSTGFWSSTQYNTENVYGMGLSATNDGAQLSEGHSSGYDNIRCLEDDGEPPSNPEPDYGTLTDSRDGNVYKTVRIGEQVWMAENLNYADSIATKSLLGNSWCYDDELENCDKYGHLYTWAAAIDSVKLATDAEHPLKCGDGKACYLPSKVQGICPEGWHLPNEEEWNTLFDAVGGRDRAGMVLKSKNGWTAAENGWTEIRNGSDAYGFSALPAAGYAFDDIGSVAFFWSATQSYTRRYDSEKDTTYYDFNEDSYDCAYSVDIRFDTVYLWDYGKSNGFSVRCIKD